MHNLQLDRKLMNNNSELAENEMEKFVDSELHSNLYEDSNEHVSDSDLEGKEEIFKNNAEELFDEDGHFGNRKFTSTEIALALSLLKCRHSLTNNCITSIL
ncbi:unnamed protein product [Adineta steineri]|uniref:Uncharacterized protein n=1 Tax=Adineta steineri TaxID=433720 RepID=A0A813YZ11_9BILA|nr:unnamed protein product [Adineta steineri]CAF4217820.1 unnamed protein product [Adineta steineri]